MVYHWRRSRYLAVFGYVSFVKSKSFCWKPYRCVSGGLPATTSWTDHTVSYQYLTKCTRILSTVCVPLPLWRGMEEIQWIDELHWSCHWVVFASRSAIFGLHLFQFYWKTANIFSSFYYCYIILNSCLRSKESSCNFHPIAKWQSRKKSNQKSEECDVECPLFVYIHR